MDPTLALAEIRRLAEQGDTDRLGELMAELDEWMSQGGLPPSQWRVKRGRPALVQNGAVVDSAVHGTRKAYEVDGCKCLACRAANRLHRSLTPEELEEYT